MIDFLTFKNFISIDILIISYYIGAVVIPILMWVSKAYLQRKFQILDRVDSLLKSLFGRLSPKEESSIYPIYGLYIYLYGDSLENVL